MNSWRITFFVYFSILGFCHGDGAQNSYWTDWNDKSCESAIEETVLEDRASLVDESAGRLQSTWVSQECEARAGPEYIIRKYTFFENGTFLLLRHHYAEESCSVATHSVSARGVIRLLSSSPLVPGATEARYQLDRVHILPLTRQVAHKFGHKVNTTCTPQQKWRPFVPQVIYEDLSHRSSNLLWEGPRFSPFQRRALPGKQQVLDCLDSFGVDFDELRLLRVQKKPIPPSAFGLSSNGQHKVELFLGSLSPNVNSKKFHKSTSLQPTSLLRFDTTSGCLICGTILRGTESSPPLLHEVAALPALLGGFWISSSCESQEDGLWMKRQFQVHSGDMLWTGRWDYYSDAQCTIFIYTVSSAGSYIQRNGRQKRHGLSETTFTEDQFLESEDRSNINRDHSVSSQNLFLSTRFNRRQLRDRKPLAEPVTPEFMEKTVDTDGYEQKESLEDVPMDPQTKFRRTSEIDTSYKHILRNAQPSMVESFAAMLRGNQRVEETPRKPIPSPIPTGTTELDLHVAESLLIAGDLSVIARCGAQITGDEAHGLRVKPLNSWPRNCVRHALEAPSTLGLRARIGVNWSGQYTLLLGPRDSILWEAPLRQCGRVPSHNPILRAHLRESLGHKYGLFSSSGSKSIDWCWHHLIILVQFLYMLR